MNQRAGKELKYILKIGKKKKIIFWHGSDIDYGRLLNWGKIQIYTETCYNNEPLRSQTTCWV